LKYCPNIDDISKNITNYTKFCSNFCPIDCITNEFGVTARNVYDNNVSNENSFKLTLNWDRSKPFINNKETPVMTFYSYFCYIGGLFGMWFGISANQLYDHLMERRLMFYYTFIKIYCWIRTKFIIIINKMRALLEFIF